MFVDLGRNIFQLLYLIKTVLYPIMAGKRVCTLYLMCCRCFNCKMNRCIIKRTSLYWHTHLTLVNSILIKYTGCMSTYFTFITNTTPRDTIAARARGVLIVKKLNKCTLSILLSHLCLDRKRPYFRTPVSYYKLRIPQISSWIICYFFKNLIGRRIGQTL